MSRLSKTWLRIARMGWEERRIRFAQEVNKRFDLALYRAGLLSNRNGTARAVSSRGNFFFSQEDLPGRISLIKAQLSVEAENIVRQADKICRHQFDLLGYANLDYGAQIDWHLDAVHGLRAPMKPWFKINFLDFDQVGDHKVIWELSRHQHLVTLAKAWRLTEDERYIIELQAQWYSWQRANPYPIGINWASSLEAAFRSLSWIWVMPLLPDLQRVEPSFCRDMVSALARHGKYIERHLSTYFSPNTHLLGEAVALFFIGTMCPEVAGANRLRKKGWHIILEEARRQVRADGVYFEQSLYYHVYALDFFLHARILAERNGTNVPEDLDMVLNRMLDVLSAVSQTGLAEGFGDDDGGRVFDPRRNRCEHMTDPLAVGAILFQREDLRSASNLTEEAVWLFGPQAVSYFENSARNRQQIGSAAFVDGGVYIMASGDKNPLQMIVDAGPQGTGRSGHGHADALSVTVALGRRRYLVDSGAFGYISSERDRFRGTGAHNTLRVDRLDQAVADGLFAWKSIPTVKCEKWITGKGFTLFAGSHTGYMRLSDPVLHRRFIFYLHDEFWLVRDVAVGQEEHQIEINWHVASDATVEKTERGFIAVANNITAADGVGCLALLPVEDSQWEQSVDADLLSPAYGSECPAATVRLSTYARLPSEHAMLLLPCSKSGEIGRLLRLKPSNRDTTAYSYDGAGKKHYMIFADHQTETWNWNGWASDASFLHFSIEDGMVADLIVCDGSNLKVNGMPVMNHAGKIQHFEWQRRTGQISSSDESAFSSIALDVLQSFSLT